VPEAPPAPATATAEPAPTSSGTSSGSKRGRDQLSDDCTSESSGEEDQAQDDDGCCSKRQRLSCQVRIKQEKKPSKTLAAADADADAALCSSQQEAGIRPLSTSQQEVAASVAELVRRMLSVEPGAAEFKQCLQHFSSGLLPGLSRDHLAGVIEVMSACHTLSLQEGLRR
jgi:hypothetical protein